MVRGLRQRVVARTAGAAERRQSGAGCIDHCLETLALHGLLRLG